MSKQKNHGHGEAGAAGYPPHPGSGTEMYLVLALYSFGVQLVDLSWPCFVVHTTTRPSSSNLNSDQYTKPVKTRLLFNEVSVYTV